MERMKLTAGIAALVAMFGLAGCDQRPTTTGADDQSMERGGGGAGGGAMTPQEGTPSDDPSVDRSGDSNMGSPSGGSADTRSE